jgi:CheY-like chemotaxis protein
MASTTVGDSTAEPAGGTDDIDPLVASDLEHAVAEGEVAVPPVVDTAGHPDPRLSGEEPIAGPRPLSLLLYSDDVNTRAAVRTALGRRIASDLPTLEWTECATPAAVIAEVDGGDFDVLILDGEAVPAGGLGLCKQLKDEKYECPPVLVLTGRPQDAWLATWSRADAAVPHPLDPRALSEAVATLARRHRG